MTTTDLTWSARIAAIHDLMRRGLDVDVAVRIHDSSKKGKR